MRDPEAGAPGLTWKWVPPPSIARGQSPEDTRSGPPAESGKLRHDAAYWSASGSPDEVELLPAADARAAGDERGRAAVLRRDVPAVGARLEAHGAVRVLDEEEGLPRSDRAPVRDERRGTGPRGGDVVAVGVRAQSHVSVAQVEQVVLLPRAGPGTVPDQRIGAVVVGAHVLAVGAGLERHHGRRRYRGERLPP